MSDIFVISDTHFGHQNILTFKDKNGDLIRPGFTDSDHMDEIMIARWNSIVRPNDIVYHLGDFSFKSKSLIGTYASRLVGKKLLILGNHDHAPKLYENHFGKITSWRQFGTDKFSRPVFMCHFPLDASSFVDREDGPSPIQIHGHTHSNVTGNPYHINVCVEHTGYTPVPIDDIVSGKFKSLYDRRAEFATL